MWLHVGTFSVEVSIWNGRGVAEQSTVIGELWEHFWSTDRVEWTAKDTVLAYNTICTRLGCQNACGTSMSLLAELYEIWYNGICLDEANGTLKPDYTLLPNGSWKYDGSSLDRFG